MRYKERLIKYCRHSTRVMREHWLKLMKLTHALGSQCTPMSLKYRDAAGVARSLYLLV